MGKKRLGKGLKIASLDDDKPTGRIRRKKKDEDDDDGGIDFNQFEKKEEPKKEEPKKEEPKKEEEKKEEKKPLGKGVKIAALKDDEPSMPRRKRKKKQKQLKRNRLVKELRLHL